MNVQVNFAGQSVTMTVPEGHTIQVAIVDGNVVFDVTANAPPKPDKQAVAAPKKPTPKPKPSNVSKASGRKVPEETLAKYQAALELVAGGMTKSAAAKQVGVKPGTFYSWTRRQA